MSIFGLPSSFVTHQIYTDVCLGFGLSFHRQNSVFLITYVTKSLFMSSKCGFKIFTYRIPVLYTLSCVAYFQEKTLMNLSTYKSLRTDFNLMWRWKIMLNYWIVIMIHLLNLLNNKYMLIWSINCMCVLSYCNRSINKCLWCFYLICHYYSVSNYML